MPDDAALLHRYAAEGSEDAFREFVRRHVNLVYGAALRRTGGDAHRAEDVVQIVFADVSRQARSLSRHRAITAWLYTATRNAAIKLMLSDRRRQLREALIDAPSPSDSAPAVDWENIRPVLDRAMDELGGADREAILLRFFEGRSFRDVGTAMRLNEDAARMRVARAVEKLRLCFARHGVTSTTIVLSTILMEHAATEAAPAGMAAGVSNSVLAGGGTVSAAGVLPLLSALTVGKLSLAALGAAALLAVGLFAVRRIEKAALPALTAPPAPVAAASIPRASVESAGPAAPAEVVQSLATILAESDPLRAYAMFARRLLKLEAGDFEADLPTLLAIAKPEQRATYLQLYLRRWGSLDPQGALGALYAARETPEVGDGAGYFNLSNSVLEGWMVDHPEEAREWAAGHRLDLDWVAGTASAGSNPNRRDRFLADRLFSLLAAHHRCRTFRIRSRNTTRACRATLCRSNGLFSNWRRARS